MWRGGHRLVVSAVRGARGLRRGFGRLALQKYHLTTGSARSFAAGAVVDNGWLNTRRWAPPPPVMIRTASTTRTFATLSHNAEQKRGQRSSNKGLVDPDVLYRVAIKQLSHTNEKQFDHRLVGRAIFVNTHHHMNRERGLANAVMLADLAVKRQPAKFRVEPKTWDLILLRMVQLDWPLDEMTNWMDSQPVDDLTREMIHVLTNTLDSWKKTDVVLRLLRHYISTECAKTDRKGCHNMFGVLSRLLVKANPSIQQLEEFVALLRMTCGTANSLASMRIVSYYLDPSHHELERQSPQAIATSFMRFLQVNRYTISWHSALGFSGELASSTQADVADIDRKTVQLAQQLENFMRLTERERGEYMLAVNGELTDANRLYEMALIRASSEPTPMDYDLCSNAALANVSDRANRERGLARAIEIAQPMAGRPGFILHHKTWGVILREMIRYNYPMEEMIHWMDTQPVENLTKAMTYVLSIAFVQMKKPEVALELLKHCVAKDPEIASNGAVLRYLLEQLLQANPTVPQVIDFTRMLSTRRLRPHAKEQLVVSFVDLLDKTSVLSSQAIAVNFLDFWEALLHGRRMRGGDIGHALGKCGEKGVRVAKVLVEFGFTKDQEASVKEREKFANVFLKKLSGEAHADFVEVMNSFGIPVFASVAPDEEKVEEIEPKSK